VGGIAQRALWRPVRTVWWVDQHPPTDALAVWNDVATTTEEVLAVAVADSGTSGDVWLNDGTVVHVEGAVGQDLSDLHRMVEQCTVVPAESIGSTLCIAFVALRARGVGQYVSVRVGSITVAR
jgi:hypothetical protein